jgi:hypothetical protein
VRNPTYNPLLFISSTNTPTPDASQIILFNSLILVKCKNECVKANAYYTNCIKAMLVSDLPVEAIRSGDLGVIKRSDTIAVCNISMLISMDYIPCIHLHNLISVTM